MAHLDWALVCELAYFDSMRRLCVLGVMSELSALALPDTITQLMFVGKLSDVRISANVQVTVGVITPSGYLLCADVESDGLSIELAREYVVVTMRGMPLHEAGVYSFRMQIDEEPELTIELKVHDVSAALPASVH